MRYVTEHMHIFVSAHLIAVEGQVNDKWSVDKLAKQPKLWEITWPQLARANQTSSSVSNAEHLFNQQKRQLSGDLTSGGKKLHTIYIIIYDYMMILIYIIIIITFFLQHQDGRPIVTMWRKLLS